ncbi:MAG: LTA synthase family protein [Clostridiales Family XIII bacterium]|nr:LTA synthase family protein [Clostridiales Family XIII bacterium]
MLFQREYTQFIENNYAKIDKNLPINSKKKKNLIYIVLESIEGTFVYDKYGFSYMKNLENISKNNVSFKNQFQIFGAGLTISAFTAQLFGLPLNLPIGVNEYGNLEKFLPNAVSSLDLLDSNNYNIAFILGSDSRFSGFDNLFKYHSINYKIYDSNEFRKEPEYDKYYDSNGWGFIDSFIYEKSKAIILEQSRKDTNFVTIIMTIDTHNPVRVIGDYPRVYGDQRDAFVEADHRVGEFLNWLKRQPFYEDTVIVILGDHLFPKNKIGQAILPKEPKRSIFNVFINSGFDVSKDKQLKTCSTIDIAPTILEAIGFSLPDRKFGLGVSLFSDQPTLLEIYGEDELNEKLSKNSKLYESFLY